MNSPNAQTWLCRGLIACVGFLGTGSAETRPAVDDPRHKALTQFFKKNDSPLRLYVSDFLKAADRYKLDWRLLPGLAMAESSGGKYFYNRNIFGWNSGRTRFESVEVSISYVASRLAQSKRFAGKDFLSIVRAYNPGHADYPERVLKHVRRMSSEPLPILAADAK